MGELKRTLGLASLSFYGVGLILGAGIYSILGEAAGIAGEGLWLAFLVASVTALLTGLSYAELSTMFPRAGAEYVYLGKAWPRHRWIAGGIGWMLVASGTATAAAVALSFGGYTTLFLNVPPWIVAAALLLVVTAVNAVGVREASWANIVFTLIEAGGLVAVIVIGARDPQFGRALLAAPSGGTLLAAGVIFFAYLGFEEIANLAEEAKHPGRDLPRAVLVAMAVSSVLYVLVALAAVALRPPADLAASASPLADTVREAAPWLVGALGGVALFATANTALITVMVASRMLFGMARDRDAPAPLARTASERATPLPALLAVMAGALALLTVGGLALIASVASVMALTAFGAVNLALIRLRYTQPDAERPFRVPGRIGRLPVLPALGAAAVLLVLTRFTWDAYALAGGIAAIALATQALVHLRRGAARRSKRARPA